MRCQADMVLSSIGYKSKPMEGVAFDASRGVVIHRCAPLTLECIDHMRRAYGQFEDAIRHGVLLLKVIVGVAGQAECYKQMTALTPGCMWLAGLSEAPLASLVNCSRHISAIMF